MNIVFILSIAVGVIIGGLFLVHRDWIGRKSLALTKAIVPPVAHGIWAVRYWVGGCIMLSIIGFTFALTRVESTHAQWVVNQQIATDMRITCQEKEGSFSEKGREYFYCHHWAYSDDETWTWQYSRAGCTLNTYNYPDMSAATEHHVDEKCRAAQRVGYWGWFATLKRSL